MLSASVSLGGSSELFTQPLCAKESSAVLALDARSLDAAAPVLRCPHAAMKRPPSAPPSSREPDIPALQRRHLRHSGYFLCRPSYICHCRPVICLRARLLVVRISIVFATSLRGRSLCLPCSKAIYSYAPARGFSPQFFIPLHLLLV